MSRVNRLWSTAVLWLMIFLCCSMALAKSESDNGPDNNKNSYLTFGFLPIESPIALFKRFAPLRDYLASQIQQEIRMETAKNFTEFSRRTEQRQYDIVFTAPHMALQALDGNHYEVAATFTKPLKSVFVVKEKSSIQNIQDLESKTIATPPNEAIVTMVARKYLDANGIKAVQYSTYQTHNAAYSAVLGGEADAAVISNFIAMKAISKNVALKIVAQSDPFPGIGILVARDLPEQLKQDLKKSIWAMRDLPQGKVILKTIAQPGYIEASKNQFEVLRPFVQVAVP
ncbi:phosphate/phosphite/phosphonate ABC transporter substrate-binding protein [Kaarinaea lacus]